MTRRDRGRHLYALVELGRAALSGPVSLGDLGRAYGLGRPGSRRMALLRLRAFLRSHGFEITTWQDPDTRGQREPLVELQADWVALEAWAHAQLDEVEVDPEDELTVREALKAGDLVDGKALAAAYRPESDTPLGVNLVAKLFGIGRERAARILGPLYRRRGTRPRVEERSDPTEARRLALERAPVWKVARALGCSWSGARSFTRRVWVEVRQGARDVVAPRLPPAPPPEPSPGEAQKS